MYNKYIFLRDNRDSFIDFLKGVSILWVILTHNIPFIYQERIFFPLWGEQAVPIFLLIQIYHGYNKLNKEEILEKYFSKKNYLKLLKRIIYPFLIVFSIQLIILFLINVLNIKDINFISILKAGGYGPGSYYIWIYLQFFFLIPIFYPILKKFNKVASILIFIFIAEFFEITSSLFQIHDSVYRLLFFRYFFLLYLGYYLSVYELRINIPIFILSLTSILFIILQNYFNYDLEPFVFSSEWAGFYWFSYFYTAFLLLYILKKMHERFFSKSFKKIIEKIGIYSYEIYLCQMFIFGFFSRQIFNIIISQTGIKNNFIQTLAYIIVTTIISVCPVLFYKKYEISRLQKNV